MSRATFWRKRRANDDADNECQSLVVTCGAGASAPPAAPLAVLGMFLLRRPRRRRR